jgi:hypothetical protein
LTREVLRALPPLDRSDEAIKAMVEGMLRAAELLEKDDIGTTEPQSHTEYSNRSGGGIRRMPQSGTSGLSDAVTGRRPDTAIVPDPGLPN